MITNKFLKNWKKIKANAIAINATSRATNSHISPPFFPTAILSLISK
jgi:hypothetical protein